MRLNRASDFALRILIILSRSENAISVEDLATRLNLPKSHVMKIVARLAGEGFVATQRGRGGGVQLACAPNDLSVGAVVRSVEREFAVVDCLGQDGPRCVFEPRCALQGIMVEATEAFLRVLDEAKLGDLAEKTQRPRVLA